MQNPLVINRDFCISSYLGFRYVAKPHIGWKEGLIPDFPSVKEQATFKVKTAAEIIERLRESVQECVPEKGLGVLLSAGMDSALIASLLPCGTRAYTIRFEAENAIDESPAAARVAEELGLKHTVVNVSWADYEANVDQLMKYKKAPLHPAEIGLFKAARAAEADGITLLAVGNGADTTFGGMDKLLSKDWTFNDFTDRYMFLDPKRAVKNPISLTDIFAPYRQDNGVNVSRFLKIVHGLGIIQMFENAIHAGGCSLVAPFERLTLDAPLDLQRIRRGESKYLLTEVFRALCPHLEVPEKIPFARPMTQWLAQWPGPSRNEFLDDLVITTFTGEQKWQLYCLERFLNLLDTTSV